MADIGAADVKDLQAWILAVYSLLVVLAGFNEYVHFTKISLLFTAFQLAEYPI